MRTAISIFLAVFLMFGFALIEVNPQEEMLESDFLSATAPLDMTCQQPCCSSISSSRSNKFVNFIENCEAQPDKVTDYGFQYFWIQKELISSIPPDFINSQPSLPDDDLDQNLNTSFITSDNRFTLNNTQICYQYDEQSFLIPSGEHSTNLFTRFPHRYPLIL